MFRSVLFPQPDGPTTETNTCPVISKVRSSIAAAAPALRSIAGDLLCRCSTVSVATRSPPRPSRYGHSDVDLLDLALHLGQLGVSPPERPALEPDEHEPVEEHDESDEQDDPGDEPLVPVGVVPVPGLVADALARREPLAE